MDVAQTFHFSTRQQGRPIDKTRLSAIGQSANASTLDEVKVMAETDQAARQTEEMLQTVDRYARSIAGYDNRTWLGETKDLNREPGKVAGSEFVVRGTLDCWNYYADGVLDFDPAQADKVRFHDRDAYGRKAYDIGNPTWFENGFQPNSMDLEVHRSSTEKIQIRTLEDGRKEISFDSRDVVFANRARFVVDGSQGTIAATFEPQQVVYSPRGRGQA